MPQNLQKASQLSEDKYALISVSDKTNIIELAKTLKDLGYHIISTGGTAKVLTDNNISIIPIQEITGNPESFDGRMKTISFQIESGILYDRANPKHVVEAKELGIKPIDIVICNLYPFEQTIQKQQVSTDEAIENIDVGGPTMVRAAAKNFKNVLVIVDPKDYEKVSQLLKEKQVNEEFRKELAAKAFAHLSLYDSQIASFLTQDQLPQEITLPGRKLLDLRYGENPHQKAAVYLYPQTNSVFHNLKKLAGRDLSLTNVSDINAGIESARLFKEPCAVVIKHNSPCGVAIGKTASEALERAIESDPESAFGGVIVLNKSLNKESVHIISSFKSDRKGNVDILAASDIDLGALEHLKSIRKSMGIYSFGEIPSFPYPDIQLKWIDGGFMVQTTDSFTDNIFNEWNVVTKKQPTPSQLEQMKVAWKFISRIRSNAVIIVDKNLPMTRGIGSGQTSRFRSTQLALEQAKAHVQGAILVSDSFFPFDDSVKLASKYGISVILQQGGSINDNASILAADAAGIAMVFTGRRAFWH